MARPKKVSLENMQIADGEEIVPKTKQARSIYEILGKKSHKYQANTQEEYVTYLKSLGMSELQSHAYECSILPIDNRLQLMDRLIREYCAQTNGYSVAAVRRESFQELHDNSEQMAKVQKILSRGK
jgi:hypothetical protein